jgi:hypothetical protein
MMLTVSGPVMVKSVESPSVPTEAITQLTEAFPAPRVAVVGIVTVVLVTAGTVRLPPLTLIDWLIGGVAPVGSVSLSVHGVAASAPAAAIITVTFKTPPAGTDVGLTARPTTELMRNGVAAPELPHFTVACAGPGAVRPGTSNGILTEVVPDEGAGLVFMAGETTIVVPEGCCESVAVHEAVAPAANAVTVAVTSTPVWREALEGTGTTAGEIVTVPTLLATTCGVQAARRTVTIMAPMIAWVDRLTTPPAPDLVQSSLFLEPAEG